MRATGMALRAAILTAALTVCAWSAGAAERIGNCEVTGSKAAFPIVPAAPGALTVQVHLPAPAWWNGDTPDRIADGFEYCLAANIAYRTGLDRVEVVNVSWPGHRRGRVVLGGDAGRPDAEVRPGPVGDLDHARAGARRWRSRSPTTAPTSASWPRPAAGLDLDAARPSCASGSTRAPPAPPSSRSGSACSRRPREFGDTPAMFMALQSGRIDVAMTDTAILLSQAAMSGGRFEVIGQFATGKSYGAIYPAGSVNAATLDRVIQSLIDDGTMAQLTATWLTQGLGPGSGQGALSCAAARHGREILTDAKVYVWSCRPVGATMRRPCGGRHAVPPPRQPSRC